MQRKKYEFWLQKKVGGEMIFKSCMVADVKHLVMKLRGFGYRVISVQEI